MQMTNTFDEARYVKQANMRFSDMAVMGDPFAGPAYGQFQKNKVVGMVIGVVASVVTMGAALPLLASTVLATQIAGGIMFAGGALSGIGAITGNKKLSKIGGIMSLAGGVGALASGAANAAGAGSAFSSGSGSSAVQNMAGSMMESVNSVGGAVGLGNAYDPSAVGAATSAGKDAAVASTIDPSNISNLPPADAAVAPSAIDPVQAGVSGDTGSGSGILGKVSTDAPVMKLGGADEAVKASAAVPGGSAPIPAATAGADTVTNPMASWPSASEPKGILSGAGSWAKENSELLKIGMSALEKGAAASMAPDQEAMLGAAAAKYGAEASMLKTQQEILEYQKNNMSKQVAMISADDPDLDGKVKRAAANKTPVVFIPAIGAKGGQPAWNAATANVAQQPARQPTFGQQPAQAAA